MHDDRTIYVREATIRYSRKRLAVPASWDRAIRCSADVAVLFSEYRDSPQEHFLVASLNARHRLLAVQELARGSATATIVPLPELFRFAILSGAHALVVAHNHPSLDCSPSPEDVALTERIHRAATLLGFLLLDHVILGDGHFSFVDHGLLPGQDRAVGVVR